MDPVSLLKALVGVLQTVSNQYESYSKLKNAQRHTLSRYKHVSEVLREDLTLYKSLFEACLHHGSGDALSELLRTESGKNAYSDLGSALERVDDLLKQLDHSVTRAAQFAMPRTGFELIMAPIVLADTVEVTTEFVDNTTAQLTKCQDDIARAFKVFHTLYLFHATPSSRNSPELPPNAPGYLTALDAVVSSFQCRPFGVSSTGKGAVNIDQLCLLNKDQKAAEKLTKLMVNVGKTWVDDQLMEEESVNILGLLQTRLMELLWSCSLEQLKGESPGLSTGVESEKSEVGDDVRVLEASLKGAIARAKLQKFSIAFCGMVKAGKSLFLNSLMGRTILPSDELPSTAWPCRLRHKKGQKVPSLTFDSTPFHRGLLHLQKCKFGQKMKSYTPPTVDPFASILGDSDSASMTDASNGEDLSSIYHCWGGLHQNTRQNLLRFEDPEFQLPARADGDVAVRNLLGEINDIVRLCHRFRLGFTMDNVDWPLLTVEFDSLRDRVIEGIFEFIDLPGLGEGFEDYDFEELIRRVAKDTPAIVPIINFKEIPKEDWKRLPDIISSGLGVRTDFVICTHFDQISTDNLPEQRTNVTKVFWPDSPGSTDRIIPCSSLMGLSAYTLLRRSALKMPELGSFWNPKKIEYHCAEKILGTGNTARNFALFDIDMWKKALKRELQRSGLPNALHRLSTDMVARARQRVLILEGRQLWRQVHKVANSQGRLLLNLRRTEAEFEQAEREFKSARGKFVSALKTWEGQEAKRDQEYGEKLRCGLDVLSTAGVDAVTKALRSTIAELGDPAFHSISKSTALLRPVATSGHDMDSSSNKSPMHNIEPGPKVLIVDSKAAAEDFFHESQRKLTHSLTELRHQFVSTIRKLVDRARKERFESLTKAIKSLDEALQPELQDEILIDLDAKAVNVQSLAFRKVRGDMKTETVRYGPKAAFQAFEMGIARPILRMRGSEDSDEEETHKAVEELGFMLRAPIAVIATVPFVLGAGIWPLVTQTKKYHLDTDVIEKRYVEKIVNPFLRDLKSEGQKSLHETMKRSADVSRAAVVDALKREDDRYAKERAEKHTPTPKEHLAQLVAIHSSFVAAEAAFERLREHLNKFI